MALTTTTLNGAVVVDQNNITVTSATGFAAGYLVRVDDETMEVQDGYVAGATLVPVLRGREGSATQAHVTGANVTVGTGSDFAGGAPQTTTAWPVAAKARPIVSYTAAGAIALPAPGSDLVAIINGTGALAMTIPNPTKDIDGSIVIVLGNGKAAHTLTPVTPVGNGGAGYAKFTFAAGAQNCTALIAANGIWVPFPSLIAGTATNISATISA